MVKQLQ